jgi:hypothetical protein
MSNAIPLCEEIASTSLHSSLIQPGFEIILSLQGYVRQGDADTATLMVSLPIFLQGRSLGQDVACKWNIDFDGINLR